MSPFTLASVMIDTLIIGILIIRVSKHLDRPENKLFFLFPAVLIMSAIALDITDTANAPHYKDRLLSLETVHTIGVYLKLSVSYLVAIYARVLANLNQNKNHRSMPLILLSLPMITALAAGFLFPQYHPITYYDTEFVIHSGPMSIPYHLIALFYLAYGFFLLYHRRKSISGTAMWTACLLILFSALGALINFKLRIVNFDIFFYSVACLVMLCIILDSNEMITILKEKNRQVTEITKQTIESLTSAIEAKDEYTEGHSARVSEISIQLAEMMNMKPEQRQNLYYAAMLHDVGKIGIRKSILNKPGRLNQEEYDIIKTHTLIGETITSKITLVPEIQQAARWHHERWDGNGYPDGLAGMSIPLIARIIGVADAYDAMSRSRVYSTVKEPAEIYQEFSSLRGKQFDPQISDLMLSLLEKEYPELRK